MDWDITVTMVPLIKDADSSCLGESDIRARWKEADITLKDIDEIELTLVHELLHVKFPYLSNEYCGYPTSSQLFKEEMEQGVESLAKCFMEAYS